MGIDLKTELVDLRRAILTMGAAVEQRVSKAVDGLLDHDVEAARSVRGGDDEIDTMEVDIEAECLRVLALSHPVASDLRFVMAVLRINADLERIGDLARSISKRVLALERAGGVHFPPALTEMAYSAQKMLADSLGALANEDAVLCRAVRRADRRVDDLQKEIFVWAQGEIIKQPRSVESILDILSIARKLERIADHATNTAENVIFVVEGAIVRHRRDEHDEVNTAVRGEEP